MMQQLSLISLLVKDYDEAIQYYTTKLKFELIDDTVLSDSKRWVVVRPRGSQCSLLMAKARNKSESICIGNQSGGRVFLFLHTDDIERDLKFMIINKVKIVRPLSIESFGRVAVFSDLYGNLWDLIQPNKLS